MAEPLEKVKEQAATILAGMMASPIVCAAFTQIPGGLVGAQGSTRHDVNLGAMIATSVDMAIQLREMVELKCSTK